MFWSRKRVLPNLRKHPHGGSDRTSSANVITRDRAAAANPADHSISRLAINVAAFGARHGLTDRELDALVEYAQGRSSSYIAEKLVLSPYTVKAHVRNIYTKTGIHNKQDLIDAVR